ncbi:MAG: hypothetical protein OEM28_10325 [Nitrosopumilus sp.]|nr:hypothetical protein [Nitrosopumilus sp.]
MKSKVLIIIGIIVAAAVLAVTIVGMPADYKTDDTSFPYDVESDHLIARNVDVSARVAMEKFPDKVCYDVTDAEYGQFPEALKQAMVDAIEEIKTSNQIAEYGKERFFFEDVSYFDGYSKTMHPKDALDFLNEHDSFKLTEKHTIQNIGHIDDVAYSFDCDINYNDHQYLLSFRFDPLYPSWENFVILNITKNNSGVSVIQNPDTVVYTSFNATVLFTNNLDYDITLSRQGGTIQNGGTSFDEITIPAGQSWPHMLRTWNLDDQYDESEHLRSVPFNYEIQPGNLIGKVTVKNYPRCMTETEVTSLYSQVNAHPKFPSYLPDGYSFECGIHNMNAYVHMTYLNDFLREKYDGNFGGNHQFEFFADGGISVDYYDEYVLNSWTANPNYDKHAKAKENAEHPRATSLTILNEPAVLTQESATVDGMVQSYNKLQVFLDDGVRHQIRAGLPQEELIKIAESLILQESD